VKRSTLRLAIIVAIPILLIIAFIASIVWSGSHFFSYNSFKIELARSTAYAQNQNCLRAGTGDGAVRIHPDNAVRIYQQITGGRFVIEDYELPVEDGILLDFGDGAILRIWPATPSGLLISFLSDTGKEYSFMTGELSQFSTLERLVQLQGLTTPNEIWSP